MWFKTLAMFSRGNAETGHAGGSGSTQIACLNVWESGQF